jgi:hypothetical protein
LPLWNVVKTALRIAMTTRGLPVRARSFGRRQPFALAAAAETRPAIGDDLKLFAATFAGGFLFVTVFLA